MMLFNKVKYVYVMIYYNVLSDSTLEGLIWEDLE